MGMTRRRKQVSVLLLAVFAVGGLLAPMAHRIVHVHDVEHQHGKAAAQFSNSSERAAYGTNFLVEEQTPPEQLKCDLCARLALVAHEPLESASNHLAFASVLRPHGELHRGRSGGSSRIRAPPVMS